MEKLLETKLFFQIFHGVILDVRLPTKMLLMFCYEAVDFFSNFWRTMINLTILNNVDIVVTSASTNEDGHLGSDIMN